MKLDIRAAIAHILRSCVFKFNVSNNIDLSSPPASETWNTIFSIRDVNKNSIGSFSSVHRSDDYSGVSYGATRSVNGTAVYNWATSTIGADGTRSWFFTQPSAFCTGLHIGDRLSNAPSAVSCSSGYYRQIASLTFPANSTWHIDFVASFPYVNTTGLRRAFCTTDTSNYDNVTTAPASFALALYDQRVCTANMVTYCHGNMSWTFTAQTTLRLIGFQNSGSANSVTGRLYAVRFK